MHTWTFLMKTSFFTDHAKTHYYTGLPNGEVLLATFNYIVPYPGTRLLLVVLHNIIDEIEVDYWFSRYCLDVSVSTVARRFHEMLHITYNQLDFLIYWPAREELWKTMLLSFCEAYGLSVAAYINDCYEIKIEKHSGNLVYSSSSHLVTVQAGKYCMLEYCIAIAPQGSTVFILDA